MFMPLTVRPQSHGPDVPPFGRGQKNSETDVPSVRRRASRTLIALAALALSSPALAAIPSYTLVGQFPIPEFSYDVLPDGRVITIDSAGVIRAQTAPNSAAYSSMGSIDGSLLPAFGAAFIRVSPDGSRLAVGDNGHAAGGRVHFLNTADLSTSAPSPTTFISFFATDAAWRDSDTLYSSGTDASFSSIVARLETSTLSATTVVSSVGDNSGGVAINGGRVYTGIGFDPTPPSSAGETRSFDAAALDTAASPVFFSTGLFAADILSAYSLGFDHFGNLVVGGGDFTGGDTGYAAVVDLANPGAPLQLDPSPSASPYYSIRFNNFTQELLVVESGIAYRYAIPTPGATALIIALPLWVARRSAAGRRRVGGAS